MASSDSSATTPKFDPGDGTERIDSVDPALGSGGVEAGVLPDGFGMAMTLMSLGFYLQILLVIGLVVGLVLGVIGLIKKMRTLKIVGFSMVGLTLLILVALGLLTSAYFKSIAAA